MPYALASATALLPARLESAGVCERLARNLPVGAKMPGALDVSAARAETRLRHRSADNASRFFPDCPSLAYAVVLSSLFCSSSEVEEGGRRAYLLLRVASLYI